MATDYHRHPRRVHRCRRSHLHRDTPQRQPHRGQRHYSHSVTDPLSEPEQLTEFTYAVTASANGLTSQPATSNTVGIGPVEPPYTQDFQSDEAFANLTVINVEESTKEWYHYTGHYSGNKWARIGYDSSNAKDDWLITPSIRLEAGKIYICTCDVCKEGGAANTRTVSK